MNKPKLIVLSGPLGSGKSTLAKKYADEHPLALVLDVDLIRLMLGQWRENDEVSAQLSKDMAEAMARINLQAGYDIIIPQIYRQRERLENLKQIAQELNADYYEILLDLDKAEAIDRFLSYKEIRKGGLIERGGGVTKLESMYDEMTQLASSRPETVRITPIRDDIDDTYKLLLDSLSISTIR